MKTYVVGGAVRDRLLGLPVSDRDHVVVGATVDAMLAAGFKPVGKDFPVFLHPETHEEYALARTERKVAPGYAGFVFHADPGVTLEEDLARRDFTVNAMAEDEETGTIVDPFDGRADLDRRLFRHVGPAFVEDPVRILRLARFSARFADFGIAEETWALIRRMVSDGEVDALVPERVWQELARGLMESDPGRMVVVLRDAGVLARQMPEVDRVFDAGGGDALLAALARAAAAGAPLAVRFAVLVSASSAVDALCGRLAVPSAVRDVAIHVTRAKDDLLAPGDADAWATRFEKVDVVRRRARFDEIVDAVAATTTDEAARARWSTRIRRCADAFAGIDAGAVARAFSHDPRAIPAQVRAARVAALAQVLEGNPPI